MNILGYVQGVFFRDNTKKKAKELGLRGYVKNLLDGSVEIVAEGDESNLKELINFCRNNPSSSRVKSIKVDYEEVKNEFEDFKVRY
jgi:acylphosphatase